MNEFFIKVQVKCGDTTCASQPGVFCPQFRTSSFGTRTWCLFFDTELDEKDGWTQRCDSCLKAENGLPGEDQSIKKLREALKRITNHAGTLDAKTAYLSVSRWAEVSKMYSDIELLLKETE